jgi:rod shape-determining protein MreC
VAVTFVIYAAQSSEARDHNWLDRIVINLTAPIQSLIEGSVDGVTSVWSDYFYLVGVREENRNLKIQNRKLQRELSERSEESFENQRLRSLLEMKRKTPQVKYLVGDVVAISPSPLFRSIRINQGSSDGLVEGLAVINEAGVVGRVKAVAAQYSDIILMVDVNNSLDIVVQRTRARARVRGGGGDRFMGIEVERLARTAMVEPGDILVTSGVGDTFPSGIPVGQVTAVKKSKFGLYQEVKLEPTVDFGKLETVLVVMDSGSALVEEPQETASETVQAP